MVICHIGSKGRITPRSTFELITAFANIVLDIPSAGKWMGVCKYLGVTGQSGRALVIFRFLREMRVQAFQWLHICGMNKRKCLENLISRHRFGVLMMI